MKKCLDKTKVVLLVKSGVKAGPDIIVRRR